jgi:1-acyl-sn-glycerol-3-phosphate acyltransferase
MMRFAVRIVAIGLLLLSCLPFHYAWRLAGRPSPWPRIALGRIARLAGFQAQMAGSPLPDHVLFVANHVSWLDIMLLASASGAAFVSKEEVGEWPVVGWLARLNKTVFIARARRGAVRSQADQLRSTLATGQPVALFPEGTTEGGETILPFRPSLLASLFPPLDGLKVQPVAIDYGAAAKDILWIGDESAGANVKRVLSRRGKAVVTLNFLQPIDPADFPDRKALAERSRAAIVAALDASEPGADRL